LSRKSFVWLGVSLAAALAVAGITAASTTGLFGGADQGTRKAVTAGASLPGGDSATHEGVTATVTGVVADDTQTVIGLSFSGREAEGEGVMPLGQAQLIDQAGRIYQEIRGSADQDNPRLVTRVFPPVDPAARSLELQVNGIMLLHRGASPDIGVRVASQWSLRVDLPGGPHASLDVAVETSVRPVGSAGIAIDRVQLAPTGAVFSGHITGLEPDQVPELGFQASLTGSDGVAQLPIGLRLGYGPDRSLFEVRFAPAAGAVTLRMLPIVLPNPRDQAAAASLGTAIAAAVPAEWSLALPR
jgi:hypothetical protein